MLTPELVRVTKKNGELHLVALNKRSKERALELAEAYLEIAQTYVGATRAEFEEACAQIEASPTERRFAMAIAKLVEDRCEFDAETELDPVNLRRDLFLKASSARASVNDGEHFDANAILHEVALAHGITKESLLQSLYSDLRAAHKLQSFKAISPQALIEHYEIAQAQAILLRAVKVNVDVQCATPAAYRTLFRKLKFLRLLHRIVAHSNGFHIEIDGPFSLFESVTKYGLQLAMLLPALMDCDRWSLHADIRWGKEREPLSFQQKSSRSASTLEMQIRSDIPAEVQALMNAFSELKTPWRMELANEILELPGVGLCVPDLVFEHRIMGHRVFVEVLGFWSREAVWRRIELVRAGLPYRILFAVSKRLRVSEDVLEDNVPGALYVYKGTLSAKTIEEKLNTLVVAS